MAITFQAESRFLFLGDHLTDAGRSSDPENVGTGYVRWIRDYLRVTRPAIAPTFINRGQAGMSLTEKAAAWEKETPAAEPDVISIMLDVPNPAEQSASPPENVDHFRTVLRQLIVSIRRTVPRARFVLCEPPALWCPGAVQSEPSLTRYVKALHELGYEFGGETVVPVHAAFTYARQLRSDVLWGTASGELTSSGHTLIAYTWLEQTGLLKRSM